MRNTSHWEPEDGADVNDIITYAEGSPCTAEIGFKNYSLRWCFCMLDGFFYNSLMTE